MSRFLCTTALEETWRDHEPLLFLGEWCRRYSRKDRWSGLAADVLPYHWDDRAKLHSDYLYLREFYERLLRDLTAQLNEMHRVDHSLRYWRILIGPWLGYFVQMLFDRWTCVQRSSREYELSGTIVLYGQEEGLVPNSMADFPRLFAGDEWNHHICATILEQFTNVPRIRQARGIVTEASGSPARVSRWRWMAVWYSRLASTFAREQDAFFLGTYLPFRDEMRMHGRLGQMPQLWRAVPAVQIAVDPDRRRWAVSGENRSQFEACARQLIPTQIPAVCLEGYGQLVEQTERLPWPKRPRLIWTSNAHNADDVFKGWAAQKAEQGSRLVIGQHGGHYGTGLWSFTEDHDIAIADSYLSWGWSESHQPNVKPVGQLKTKQPQGIRHSVQPRALLVACCLPRFSYWMYSVCVSRQWLDYFEELCAFTEQLPHPIQDALTVRLYPQDFGWDQVARWRDRFPDLHLDPGDVAMKEVIRRSRLHICTYNATTYLESFTMNVPTVIYWNPSQWELRESAQPYFEDLERVGIFHKTPESAARHVTAVWDDVDAWWSGPQVQQALERFKQRFCHLPDDLLDRVEQALREAMIVPGEALDTAQ